MRQIPRSPGRPVPRAVAFCFLVLSGIFLAVVPVRGGEEEGDRVLRVTHEGGAIWIVFHDTGDWSKKRSSVDLQIVNEGAGTFSLSKKDAWFGTSAAGEKIPLKLEANASAKLAPRQCIALTLVATVKRSARIVALGYRSEALGREVEVNEFAAPTWPQLSIPAAYDPEDAPGSFLYPIELIAIVGADGQVEAIVDSPVRSGPGRESLYESARSALRQWRFARATPGGPAAPTLFRTTFVFQRDRLLRASFPLAPEEFIPRLRARLHQSSYAAVELPSVGGYATVGYASTAAGTASGRSERIAGAFLVRAAAEVGGSGTWLTVNSMALARETNANGDGAWASPIAGSREFIAWLGGALGLPAATTVALSEGGYTVVPGGALEPVDRGRWNPAAIRSLLKLSLEAEPDAKARGVRIDPADPRLPTEANLLAPTGEPDRVPFAKSELITPPKLIEKWQPDYPEAARQSKIQGTVELSCVVDTRGNVAAIESTRSPHPLLRAAAINAVRRWKYEPATFEGRPVPVHFTVQVNFSTH